MKNPFSILGLAPTILVGLSKVQIESLVASQYRALSLIHHPDRDDGDAEKFKDITWAFAELKDEANFFNWKELYLKSRKDKLLTAASQLEEKVTLLGNSNKDLADRLKIFWQALCNAEGKKLTVFNLCNASMLVCETLEAAMRKASIVKTPGRATPFKPTESTCNLEIDDKGVLTKYSVKKEGFDARKVSPPDDIPKDWINHNESTPWQSYYWKRTGVGQILTGVKIGMTLSYHLLKDFQFRESDPGFRPERLIKGSLSSETYDQVRNGFTFEQIEKFAPVFSPFVESLDELVLVKETDDGPRFILMGSVRQLVRIHR